MLYCAQCKLLLPPGRKDRLCSKCRRHYARKWRKLRRDEYNAYQKQYAAERRQAKLSDKLARLRAQGTLVPPPQRPLLPGDLELETLE